MAEEEVVVGEVEELVKEDSERRAWRKNSSRVTLLGPLVNAPNTVPIACPVFSFVSHVRVKVFPLTRRTFGGVFTCSLLVLFTSHSLAVSLSRAFD